MTIDKSQFEEVWEQFMQAEPLTLELPPDFALGLAVILVDFLKHPNRLEKGAALVASDIYSNLVEYILKVCPQFASKLSPVNTKNPPDETA